MIEDKYQELETSRLILRKIVDEDAKDLYINVFCNLENYKYYTSLIFNTFEEYEELVQKYKA